jgi:hypothetical protein
MRLHSPWVALLLMLVAFEAAGQGTLDLHYTNGQLSLRAEQVTVKTLLQRVAQVADIRLHLAEGISETPVSWTFSDVPMAEALARLVRPNDFAIFYAPDQITNRSVRIADLFVFPPSPPATVSTAAVLPAELETRNEAQRLGHLIAAPGDMDQRRQAIADLLALNSPAAAQGLELALGVPEPELRCEVVQALGEAYRDAPPAALGQVVMGDRDPQVRQEAVRILAGLGGEVARLFIEQATKDQDENVREAARKALSGINGP